MRSLTLGGAAQPLRVTNRKRQARIGAIGKTSLISTFVSWRNDSICRFVFCATEKKYCLFRQEIQVSSYSFPGFISVGLPWVLILLSEGGVEGKVMKTTRMVAVMIGVWLIGSLGLGIRSTLSEEVKGTATPASDEQPKWDYMKKVDTRLEGFKRELKK